MNPCLSALFVLAILSAFPAFADESHSIAPDEEPTRIGDSRTALIVDTERGVIRFVIEGEEMGLIDREGLYIRDHISFGGTLTDTGRITVKDKLRENRNGQ